MLSSKHLLTGARRLAPRASTPISLRLLSTSAPRPAWEGRQPDEHVTNEKDTNNVQHDAEREGKSERASGSQNSTATSQKGEGNTKAKKDHPEAPGPVIGMNDERGGKGH